MVRMRLLPTNSGLVTDLPDIEAELKSTLESIVVKDSQLNAEAVTFTITNNSGSVINPSITSDADGEISTFTLNRQDYQPYLSNGEKGSIDFSIDVVDSSGNTNSLPCKLHLTGVSYKYKPLVTIENRAGGSIRTDNDLRGIEDQGTSVFSPRLPRPL